MQTEWEVKIEEAGEHNESFPLFEWPLIAYGLRQSEQSYLLLK